MPVDKRFESNLTSKLAQDGISWVKMYEEFSPKDSSSLMSCNKLLCSIKEHVFPTF